MAGGSSAQKQNSELRKMNIEVTEGGVHMGAILEGNNFQGDVTSRTIYTGPSAREGAGPVPPREQNDGTLNIRNEGSQSHQIIAHNNTVGGTAVFEQNINIQPTGQNNEGRNEEHMDLR